MISHSDQRLACLKDVEAWTKDLESKLGGAVKTGFNADMEGEVPFIRCSIPMMVLAGDWVWEPRWFSYFPPHVPLWSNWERPPTEVFLRGIQEFESIHKVPPTFLIVSFGYSWHIRFLLFREEHKGVDLEKYSGPCPSCNVELKRKSGEAPGHTRRHHPECIFFPHTSIPWSFFDKKRGIQLYHVNLEDEDREALLRSLQYGPLRNVVSSMLPAFQAGDLSEQDMEFMLSLTAYLKEGRVKERLRRVFSHRIVDTFPYGNSHGPYGASYG